MKYYVLLLGCLLLSNSCFSQVPGNDSNWEIEFEDNFNDSSLFDTYYQLCNVNARIHCDNIDCAELQCYQRANITYDSGYLFITAKQESPVDKLRLLNGVRFDVKDSFYKYADIKVDSSYLGLNPEQSKIKQEDEAYKNKLREKSKNQIGFIAQELKEIFPELVYQMDDTSYYAINYIGLIPVMVEAFKEQQSLIEKQSEKIAQLKKSFDTINISKKSATLYDTLKESNTTSGAVLYQNSPNPFNQSTTIEYFISYEFDAAFIYIFDMNGSQISSKELDKTGDSSITLGSSELEPGMYFYTLVVDGLEIDTKKMILTRN